MITIFLLCKYFKPSTTSLAHVGMKSAERGKVKLVYEMDKIFWSAKTFCNSKRAKIEARILHHYWSLLKIQGTGLCSCGLLYCSTVRLLSRNRISSQWTRHYCFWQPLFLVFPLYFARYTDPNVPQPNLFSFSKSFHSNFGNSGSFFAFLFRLVGILKLAAILFHLTRREKSWERGCHFGQILARNCGPSPRFTNRVQSAFY